MISKGIGITLVLVALILGVWFVQMMRLPDPAPLTSYVVAAVAVAMLSVGIRYIVKSNKKKPKPGEGPAA
jgi:hypothetical protein